MTAKSKKDALDAILSAVREKFGKQTIVRMSDGFRSEVKEVIPTGVPAVDRYVLGCGGLPVGRLTELYSEEGAGKSSFTLGCLAACQRDGGVAILAETEAGINEERAKVFGLDLEHLLLIQPAHMEGCLGAMELAIESVPRGTGPVLLAWDSIAATLTKKEAEEGLMGDAAIGDRARLLSRACRMLLPLAEKKRIALLFVNQIREKIGVMFGDKFTTPGGRAVKFHASARVQLFSGAADKDEAGGHRGKTVTFLATKNRFAPPFRKARVRLDYFKGWDADWATLEHAKNLGVVEKKARGAQALEEARKRLDEIGWTLSGAQVLEVPDAVDAGDAAE